MEISNAELAAVRSIVASPARFEAYSGTYKVVPKERLRAAGWKVTKGMRPPIQACPDTWVDTETGEILTATEARRRGLKLPPILSNSDKALRMFTCIAECAPTERPFVSYLLKMRNHRGGLLASLDVIVDRWIDAACPGIRSTDKARKRKQLRSIIERRKLMVNDTTMAKDLMLLNPGITKQDVLEEHAKLYSRNFRCLND